MVQTIFDNVLIKKLIKFFSIGVLSTLMLIGTAMDPFHWRRNGPTPFVP